MVKDDYYPSTEILEVVRGKGDTVSRLAVVFGREESGLTNEELDRCNIVSRILMRSLYPSLNLGQAVMIYAYTLSPLALGDLPKKKDRPDTESLSALLSKVEAIFDGIGMDRNALIYNRYFERLNALGEDDIHLLHSVCNLLMARLDIQKPRKKEALPPE